MKFLNNQALSALISLEIVKNRIFDWDPNNNYIAFTSTKNEEINSSYRLRRINDEFKSGIVIEDSILEEIEKELNITLSENQRNAFKMLESGGVNILTGGPGTGKTTIAKGIILYFQKKNPGATVLLCAPTGRAAKRLSESTNMESKTAHKLLEFKPFQGCEVERNNNNPLEADFIIADEGSMFDIHLFNMLLNAIPKNCRLLIIGDENQLPSVGAGNVLHDMIESNLFGVYRLTDNFRSDSSIKNAVPNDISQILEAADIRQIFTNGKKSHEIYMKYCYPKTGREDICLPSTSPANAAFRLDSLIKAWEILKG